MKLKRKNIIKNNQKKIINQKLTKSKLKLENNYLIFGRITYQTFLTKNWGFDGFNNSKSC